MKRLTQKQKENIYVIFFAVWYVLVFSFIDYIIVKMLQSYPPNFWYK